MSKHKAKKRPVLHRNRFDCIDCGLGVWVDEDGLCRGCGRQTVIIENGVPDYSAVLAGIEADEASAARLADRVACSAPPPHDGESTHPEPGEIRFVVEPPAPSWWRENNAAIRAALGLVKPESER